MVTLPKRFPMPQAPKFTASNYRMISRIAVAVITGSIIGGLIFVAASRIEIALFLLAAGGLALVLQFAVEVPLRRSLDKYLQAWLVETTTEDGQPRLVPQNGEIKIQAASNRGSKKGPLRLGYSFQAIQTDRGTLCRATVRDLGPSGVATNASALDCDDALGIAMGGVLNLIEERKHAVGKTPKGTAAPRQ